MCSHVAGQFLSTAFLHPKPNGSWRFTLNLKKLYKFVSTTHFKLEDLRTATKPQNVSWPLLILKMHIIYCQYIKRIENIFVFLFKDILYEFTCLPFGLSKAPYVFTKIMKPVVFYLRSQGLLSVIYLDDILCLRHSCEMCLKNISTTQNSLENLGFIINKEKSCLIPRQACQYLGFINLCPVHHFTSPEKDRIYLQGKCKGWHKCKILEFTQLLGMLIAACPAVEYGCLYTKVMDNYKTTALKNSDRNYKAFLTISKEIQLDLD